MTAIPPTLTTVMLNTKERDSMNWFAKATARAGLGLRATALMGLLALGPQLPTAAPARPPAVSRIFSSAHGPAEQSAAHAVVRSGGSVDRQLALIDGFEAVVPAC